MRGQVSIFIIAAVFLVIVIGIFFFIFGGDDLERGTVLNQQVSEEVSPVKTYVESCMASVGEQAIRLAGERGGYVFTEQYALQSTYDIRYDETQPTEAANNALYRAPGLAVPYWFYVDGNNGAGQLIPRSKKPVLLSEMDEGIERLQAADQSTEAQIDRYVNAHLETCLNNFEAFLGYDINATSLPVTTTYVTDQDVILNLQYPLEIQFQDETERVEQFGVRVDVPLKEHYQFAELITQSQATYTFLENHLLDLIVFYSGPNDVLAPLSDFTFALGSPGGSWTVQELYQGIQLIIASNTPFLQVEGTQNQRPIPVLAFDGSQSVRQNIYENMVLPIISAREEEDVPLFSPSLLAPLAIEQKSVRFHYLGNPLYFDVNDDGGIVKAEVVGIEELGLGMQKYQTTYDVSWPILVTIQDDASFAGDGYTFTFALEGNIRNNRPLDNSVDFALSYDPSPSICDTEQRTRNITVEVLNDRCEETCEPLEDIAILFHSGQVSCSVGVTNSEGIAHVLVPEGVINAQLQAVHQNYLSEFIPYAPSYANYSIRGMREKRPFTVELSQKTLSKNGTAYSVLNTTPTPVDNAVLILSRIKEEEDDGNYETSITYPETKTLDLVDGLYTVDILLLEDAEANSSVTAINAINELEKVIPDDELEVWQERKQRYQENLLTAGQTQQIRGGVVFPEDAPLRITRGQAQLGENITFYALAFEDADPLVVGRIEDFSKAYLNELIPEIS